MDVTFAWLFGALMLLLLLLLLHNGKSRLRVLYFLEQLPGPRALPLLGNALPLLLANREELFSIADKYAKKFGPVFRLWIGSEAHVHMFDPNTVEVVLNSTKHMDKAVLYKFLHPWLGTGLLTSTGSKWHLRRKMITPTFHFKMLDNFMSVYNSNAEIMVERFQKTKGYFDIYPYVCACTLDIICETAMGTKVNAQLSSTNSEYVEAIFQMGHLVFDRFRAPWYHNDWIFQFTPAGRRMARYLKTLHGFTNKVIQERREERRNTKQKPEEENDDLLGLKKKQAFLDLLLEVSEGDERITDQDIREEVDTFMFEGHDTTATALCWALYILGRNPDVQEKAYQEVKEIFGDSDRPASMQDLNNMPYLERCVKETLRMFPSVPFIGRTATEEFKIGDYTIPAGTTLAVHIYHVHRNPDIYPNPDNFNPDNFLPERVKGRHPYAYIPFSAGPRNCIGQKFAMLEEKALLSAILRRFKLSASDKLEDLTLVSEMILRSNDGIRLRVEERK